MNNLVTKLSSLAALLGVVAAIGTGFIQLGKIQAKLDELDKREPVINQTVNLEPVNQKIADVRVELEQVRTEAVGDEVINNLWNLIISVEQKVNELSNTVAVVSKENELQAIQIEEIKQESNNPLTN